MEKEKCYVFKHQKFPQDIQNHFFSKYRNICNDVWVSFEVDLDEDRGEEHNIISKYFINLGYKEYDVILISHWW